jgi:hypothetical protein
MVFVTQERARLGAALFARGIVLFGFAAVAIRWPEAALFFAIVGAGASAATLGFFQLGMHVASQELPSTKFFLIGDGVGALTFGMLCIGMPLLSPYAAVMLMAAWMLIYAAGMLVVSGRVWYVAPARIGLLSWSTANVAFAVAALAFVPRTLNDVLYWTAVYIWCFGLAHVAAGLWLRRRHRRLVARVI